MERRKFLSITASSGLAATAGCIGPLTDDGNQTQMTGDYAHPSMADISDLPTIGPSPEDSDALIVAFEDPACPICANFHNGPFQELKDNYITSGDLTFIHRGIDVIYDWGKIPLQIQQKVNEEKPDKVFDIIQAYYSRQDNISSDNVMEISKEILRDNGLNDEKFTKNLDKYSNDLQNNLSASKKSSVRGTPTLHLFKEKKHETKVVGSKPPTIYESILNL